MNDLTRAQYDVLMKPLPVHRVRQRKVSNRTFSYLEAWDVKAHLNRIFGFGGWDTKVLSCTLLFCDQIAGKGNWNVSYQVTLGLHVKCTDTVHEDGAVGSAHLPDRGEALDMALKTAMSDAIKRCAIAWGTQFGLSLYNNGQLADVVKATLVVPEGAEEEPDEVAEGVEVASDDDAPVIDNMPEAVDPDTGEIVDPWSPSAYAEAFVIELRKWARETDSAKRILAVAEIKTRAAGQDWLNQTTDLPNGQSVTLIRLADLVAQGAFLNGGDPQ